MSDDLEIRREELHHRKSHERELLDLQERELRLKHLTNPVLVAVLTLSIAALGQCALGEQAQTREQAARDRFCFDAIRSFVLDRDVPSRNAAREMHILIDEGVVPDCDGKLDRVVNRILQTTTEPPIPDQKETCGGIASIRSLGWRSGHKTRFCIANGFDGIHNPFGDYKAGGFCYKGDFEACRPLMK